MKHFVELEHLIEGKIGRFIVEHDAPINIVKTMLYAILGQVQQIEKQGIEAQKSAEQIQNEPPKEEENEKTVSP